MNDTALQMADELDRLCDPYDSAIATELRRLHAENEAMRAELAEQARVNGMGSEREARLMAVNAELVEALRFARTEFDALPKSLGYEFTHITKIDAALAKVGDSK